MIRIRQAAVAGSFYPADPDELSAEVQRMLEAAPLKSGPAPRALIVPHAGYIYSGPVAATAYSRLRSFRRAYRRVILLGPCHFLAIHGMAVSDADYFHTPLGGVPLDRAAISSLSHPDLHAVDAAHRSEHSLEVQLPFLQSVLESFTLVPIVVGQAEPEAVSEVIDALWSGPETLVVVSSDLSHYLDYETAQERDLETCHAIEAMHEHGIGQADACGSTPLRGLLGAARRRGMRAITLDLRNSGDTAGRSDQVVGYGAWMLVEDESCKHAA